MYHQYIITYNVFHLLPSRNQSYKACIHLAVLDHNNHNSREQQKNSSGEIVYHRKYRKQTKKWDTTPTLTSKKYEYVHPRAFEGYL